MVVITNSEKLKEGFFFWIFVVLLMAISAFREGPGLILQFALLFLGMGTALLCHSAAIDYISGMWGGMGTAKGITAGFMAASLPLGFSVFFMLIGAYGVNEISSAGTFILSLWAFYLDVLAIIFKLCILGKRRGHRRPFGKHHYLQYKGTELCHDFHVPCHFS